MDSKPLVHVITPVYNGERFLAECIESVLSQTYENWKYTIVNNLSTDRTSDIAQHYAEQDTRIKVHTNETYLDLIPNWNNAIRRILPNCKYCKVVHADDLLFPECVSQMVKLAEQHQEVGIVGAYVLKGTKIEGLGIPYPKSIISGRQIAQATLRKELYVFGSPSSTLIRADLVRKRHNFYNEKYFHADVEVCFNELKSSDFGFVHQLLTYTRLHKASQTTTVGKIQKTEILENLRMLKHYGPLFFSEEEYEEVLRERLKTYRRFFGKYLLQRNMRDLLRGHREALAELGISIKKRDLAAGVSVHLLNKILNPKQTLGELLNNR